MVQQKDIILLNVLVVDDDDVVRFSLMRIFGNLGCETFEANSIATASAMLVKQHVDVVFCDVRFPGNQSGIELIDVISRFNLPTRVVMMSCAMDADLSSYLKRMGAAKCLQKPFFKADCMKTLNILYPSHLLAV